MLELNKVHISTKPGLTEPSRIISTNPYMCLSKGDVSIFIQNGSLYYNNGSAVDKTPEWFAEELSKCSPEALAEVGYKLPKVKEK